MVGDLPINNGDLPIPSHRPKEGTIRSALDAAELSKFFDAPLVGKAVGFEGKAGALDALDALAGQWQGMLLEGTPLEPHWNPIGTPLEPHWNPIQFIIAMERSTIFNGKIHYNRGYNGFISIYLFGYV